MTTRHSRSIVFFVARTSTALALLLFPMALASQNPPQAPPIRVSTHLVQIGVIVRDANGLVGSLTKDDFVVLDRGKPQKISVFSTEVGESEPQPVQPLPQNMFSDLPQYGSNKPRSVTIVLLDNLNTLSGSSPVPYEDTPYWLEDHALAIAKQRLIEFLKQMDPNDRIAIYGLTDTVHVLCDFTCDRNQLLAVVSKYDTTSRTQREAVEPGAFHFPQPADNTRAFDSPVSAEVLRLAELNNQARAQATMAALIAIAAHVADIPGRKNLLWLTANLPFSGKAIALVLGRASIAAYPVDARGLIPRGPLGSWNDVFDADSYARGEMGPPPAQSDQPIGIDTMMEMAADTGGHAFVNTNDITGAIRKIVEDSAVTYTLGFYVEPSSLDGKFHEVKVQVKRSGLTVSYPKGYFALKDAPATQDERRNNLLAAIKSPLASTAILLQVKVDRVNHPTANSLSLFGSIGIHDFQLVKDGELHVGAVDVTVIEQDVSGKVLLESTNRINLRFTEGQYSAILKSGITFRKSVKPQAEATTLRVLVQDPNTGAVGSLIIPLSQLK
jgi:VWFA-related protein